MVRPKHAPEPVRRAASATAAVSATPRYVRASLRLGGLHDPEEHEAEHAAGVIAGGGSYQVRDPGGTSHLRASVAAPVVDPGAAGRVRRAVAAPVVDPAAGGRVRRASAADGAADSGTAHRIHAARSAAARPLPPTVRSHLEKGFGEDLSGVRVHTGPAARNAARGIGARAYTEGERITVGHGESEHDVRLMAHEATHVVQNRRAAGVTRAMSPPQIRRSEQPIRRLGLGTILDALADLANMIPGYRLFTIILGMNPINQEQVERSGANILRGAVELIPLGGLIVKALDTYGVFEKAGAWIEEQIATLGMVGGAIRDALMTFLDSLGLSDIIHPGDVWARAKRIFTEPIDRIGAFFKAVAVGIVELIKTAILKPLAALASQTRAWDLLVAILGSNPITGEPATPGPEAVIGGFMKLAGQEDVWASIQKANALARCWAWFQKSWAQLLGFVSQVPGLFISALKSFQVSDLLDLPGALVRVAGMFGGFIGQFISWVGSAIWALLEIVFDVVSPGALGYIKKTGAALKSIFKNPLPFVGNLVKAAKLGFENFSDNILTHLKNGLIDWLTGSLPGVYIPKAISLIEIGKFALSVLGVSWAQIRGKIVKALGPTGETIMKGLEVSFDVVKALVTGGPAAAWEIIKDKLTNLKDAVIDGIIGFVTDSVVKKAIPKLAAMFIPGAGFISAIISIYDTVMVFVEKIAKIAAAVKAFVDSIVAIAAGQIDAAAAKVESTLAGLLSLAISFLAGFAGLGKVADKIKDVIQKVWTMVDKGLDTAVTWIVGKAKALFGWLFGGKGKDGKKDERTDAQKQADLGKGVGEARLLLTNPALSIEQIRKKLPQIVSKYQMRSLELIEDTKAALKEKIHVHGVVNPELDSPMFEKTVGGIKYLVFRTPAGSIKVTLPDDGTEATINANASKAKQIESLMSGLDMDKESAQAIVAKLPASDIDAAYNLLVQFARNKVGENMPPDEFILQQLQNQRATSAAFSSIPNRERRAGAVNIGEVDVGGEKREPLSEYALVFKRTDGKWIMRPHSEAMMNEFIYEGVGRASVVAYGAIKVDDSGNVVQILRVAAGMTNDRLIKLMRSAGWRVNL